MSGPLAEERRLYKLRKIADGFEGLTHGKIATYKLGCRCHDCRAINTSYAHTNPKQRAHRLARHRIATWAITEHREKWDELFAEAMQEIKEERS